MLKYSAIKEQPININEDKPNYVVFTGALGGMKQDFQDILQRNNNKFKIFKYNQLQKARQYINTLTPEQKNKLKIYGHSWGSYAALNLGHQNKDNQVHIIDPVSRKKVPEFVNSNSKVYYPDNIGTVKSSDSLKHIIKQNIGNAAALVGKRIDSKSLNASPQQIKNYEGNHLGGVYSLFSNNIKKDNTPESIISIKGSTGSQLLGTITSPLVLASIGSLIGGSINGLRSSGNIQEDRQNRTKRVLIGMLTGGGIGLALGSLAYLAGFTLGSIRNDTHYFKQNKGTAQALKNLLIPGRAGYNIGKYT